MPPADRRDALERMACRLVGPSGTSARTAVFDPNDLSSATERMTLTPSQAGIGLGLQQYYQFVCVGPTPERLRMLLVELNQRAEAGSAS